MSHVKKGETLGVPYQRSTNPQVEKKLFEENVQAGTQCRIRGTLDLPKVPIRPDRLQAPSSSSPLLSKICLCQ